MALVVFHLTGGRLVLPGKLYFFSDVVFERVGIGDRKQQLDHTCLTLPSFFLLNILEG